MDKPCFDEALGYEVHTLVGPDLASETVTCEVCGHSEPADPHDVAEQYRLLAEMDADS